MKTANEILMEKRELGEGSRPSMDRMAREGLSRLQGEIQAALDKYAREVSQAASFVHPSAPAAPEIKKKADAMMKVLTTASRALGKV